MKGARVRQNKASNGFYIAIPRGIGQLAFDSNQAFCPEWHEDGILLRRVELREGDQPEWLKKRKQNDERFKPGEVQELHRSHRGNAG